MAATSEYKVRISFEEESLRAFRRELAAISAQLNALADAFEQLRVEVTHGEDEG